MEIVRSRSRKEVVAFLVVLLWVLRRIMWWFRAPYGPKLGRLPYHPVFGRIPGFLDFLRICREKKHMDYSCELHELHGQTYAASMPFSPWWIVTRCPKNVEYVLSTNFKNYPKGAWSQGKLMDLLGRGIFNVDGEEWHLQRKTASHMFTAKLFREHIWLVVIRNSQKLRTMLETADPTKPLDVFNLMNRFTLDTIGEIGFGKSIGSLEDPSSPFLASFDIAQQTVFRRFFLPAWWIWRLLGRGPERDTAEHFGRLDDYARNVVRELRANIARGEDSTKLDGDADGDVEARKSFLGLFLQDARSKGEDLSEDYLRDLVLNFLIAGRDTTAQALSWTMFCLCKHPDVETRARQEVVNVCQGRECTYEEVGRLPFLQAVLSEALRLYPSVPIDIKCAVDNDTLPDGTWVPRGSIVMYNIYGMNRDSSIWGEDAHIFRPERWLENPAPNNYTYPVFNAGPRECLGRRLSLVEMKTCLATILPHVTFKLAVPEEEIIIDGQLTIGMSRGLPCFVAAHQTGHDGESTLTTAPSEDSGVADCASGDVPHNIPEVYSTPRLS